METNQPVSNPVYTPAPRHPAYLHLKYLLLFPLPLYYYYFCCLYLKYVVPALL